MALDLKKLKNRQVETAAGSGGSFWKPKEGKNYIRVFKFAHEVTDADVKAGFFSGDKIGETVEELDRPVVRHFGINGQKRPVPSTKEIMAEYNRLKASKSKEDQERAEAIRPSTAFFLNVVNMEDVEKGMLLYGATKTVYHQILECVMDSEFGGERILGSSGRDFIINFDPKAAGALMYTVQLRDQERSEALPSEADESFVDFFSKEGASQIGAVASADGEVDPVEEVLPDPSEEELNGKSKKMEEEVESIFGAKKKAPAAVKKEEPKTKSKSTAFKKKK